MTRNCLNALRKVAAHPGFTVGVAGLSGLLGAIAMPLAAKYIFDVKNKLGLGLLSLLGGAGGVVAGGALSEGLSGEWNKNRPVVTHYGANIPDRLTVNLSGSVHPIHVKLEGERYANPIPVFVSEDNRTVNGRGRH